MSDPYSRLYHPTPVPELNDGGQDWWILMFGSNKAVPIGQLVEAVCTLPLEEVATAPEKLVDTLARAFAPEEVIHKSQVTVVLGLIDPAAAVDINVGFTGTQLLQYLLDRTLLQVSAPARADSLSLLSHYLPSPSLLSLSLPPLIIILPPSSSSLLDPRPPPCAPS